ncbi:zinc finger protein 197-like isoform X1 [Pieris brassicae]|uniref:zinc finger protein 197-like isoform X1 n=1 Tax=Pieris brassicae TaxID=7116 RepID=UPI001E65FBDD|nr:zinc finger protein 197-like isoform X1 [Pieris brassicae]XP_045529270.1 zinc finger protein 197-like isoform X1 [Pieris brassicae]
MMEPETDKELKIYSEIQRPTKYFYTPKFEAKDTLTSKDAVKFLLDGTLRLRVCKYCLNITQNLNELDEIIVVAGKCGLYEVTINDIVTSFYPVKVNCDTNFPNKICSDCLDRAFQCYFFTQQCEQAGRALHNYLEDLNEKFNKLDPMEPLKRRGKPKLYLNHNVLNMECKNVIDYAEPLINLINLNALPNDLELTDLECPKCWQVLPNITSLVNHEKSHPKSMWYYCKQCGKAFVKYTQLKKHKRNEHSQKIEDINLEKIIFACKQCGISNESLSKHLLHIEKHSFTKTLSELIMNPKGNCAMCFNKAYNMVHLNENMHMHGGGAGLTGEKSISNIVTSVFPDITLHYSLEDKICKHCLNKLITSYIFILNVRNNRNRLDECVGTMVETLKHVDENKNILIEVNQNVVFPAIREDLLVKDDAEEFLEDEFRIPDSDTDSDAKSTHSTSTDDIIRDNPARNATKTYAKRFSINGFQQSMPIDKNLVVKTNERKQKCLKKRLQKFTCPLCYRHFVSDYFLKKHVIKHVYETTECSLCNENFKSNFDCTEHKKVVHTLNLKTFASCGICGRSFKNMDKLKMHSKKHSFVECPLCNKIFKSQPFFEKHMVRHQRKFNSNRKHIETCSFCERDYSNENELSLHVNKVHLQIKPYNCDMCEKQFYTELNLRSHKKLHNVKSREECTFCHKTFMCRKSLVIHLRKHIDIKPHYCPVCSKSFYSESSMKYHMKKLHGGRYCCRLCKHIVNSNIDLKNHFKVAHTYKQLS